MIDTKEVVVNSEESSVSDIRKDEGISSTPSEYENDDRRNLASQQQGFEGMDASAQNKNSDLASANYYAEQHQQMIPKGESALQLTEPITNNFSEQAKELDLIDKKQADQTLVKVRKPIIKKTFALKKIGYKVVPYEDESDFRYSFTNENVVFVNKANSTYRAEAARGDEFLLRHIIGIVAEAIAETKHPEGKVALEFQNRLVSEAIRIHDYSVIKK
jgi:hypothetical protein